MNDFLKVLAWGGVFAVLFLPMFVVNDYFFPFITGKNFAFRIIVEIAFVAWALLALVDTKYRPKFSWILTGFASLLIVMFFANLFGENPQASFWSNFERMDGYVTLVHVFLYVVVLGSVLTTKRHWNVFLNTTLGVAFVVAMYGLSTQAPSARIESFLGNSAYLAIYLFFHIYIAFWMFVENRSTMLRTVYGLLALMFIYTLVETGTRGTILGLIAGTLVMVAYVGLFGSKFPEFRKYAIGAFVLLVVGVGSFYSVRNSDFIQNSGNLARIANISLSSDLQVRGTIWGMAWEGVQERPFLGWGQSNFNYVFNKNYDPFLYNQEQWFDRVHDIFLDWLIAGGFLGLIAYLSIFVAGVYYLLVVPIIKPEDQTFTTLERGVLLGILAGYMTHNLVVFDNIISYIFFAVILALIHSRVGEHLPQLDKIKIDKNIFSQFMVPVSFVLVGALIYTMHVPGIQAAGDIIDGYRAPTAEQRLEAFELALSRDSFAHQEITEQIAQQAMSLAGEKGVSDETKKKFIIRAETELNKLVVEKPGDARVHVFFSTFYRSLGEFEKAATQMDIARTLSPRKQSVIMQQAIIKYSQNQMELSRDLFKEAFLLDERNDEAREYYASMLFATGDPEAAKALITDERIMNRFALNDFILSSVSGAGDTAFLTELYKSRVTQQPNVAQNWASLAFLYYQNKDNELAIDALEQAKVKIPTFSKSAECFIGNIKQGKDPQEGC